MLIKKLDYVNPIKLYNVLREYDFPFILESMGKHERKARYTYVSANPEFIVEVNGRGTRVDGKLVSKERNPFKALREIGIECVDDKRFNGGYVGYIAYDSVHNYIGGNVLEPSVFGYYKNVFVYDHVSNLFYYLSLIHI